MYILLGVNSLFVTGILEAILEKHRCLVTATPPPSPTHGNSVDQRSNVPVFSPPTHSTGKPLSFFKKNLAIFIIILCSSPTMVICLKKNTNFYMGYHSIPVLKYCL